MFGFWIIISCTSAKQFLYQGFLETTIEEFLKKNVLNPDICNILNKAKEEVEKQLKEKLDKELQNNRESGNNSNTANSIPDIRNNIKAIAQKLTLEEIKVCLKDDMRVLATEAFYGSCFPVFLAVLYKLIINKYFYTPRMPYLLRILISPAEVSKCAFTIKFLQLIYLMHFTKNARNILDNVIKEHVEKVCAMISDSMLRSNT